MENTEEGIKDRITSPRQPQPHLQKGRRLIPFSQSLMPGQGREASMDRKEFVDKDVLMITEQLRAKANPLTPTASRKNRDLLKELTKSKKKKKGAIRASPTDPSKIPSPGNCWCHHYRLSAHRRWEGNKNLSPNKAKYTRQQPSKSSPIQCLIIIFCNLQPCFWKVSKSPPADPSQCTMAFNNCLRFSPGKPGKHPQFITRVTFRALSPQMIFTHFNLTTIQNRSAVSSLNSVAP